MTLLIASIAAPTAETMIQRACRALAEGADAVELRLDALADAESASGEPAMVELARALPPGRWIATCRSRREGGESTLDPRRRFDWIRSVAGSGAGYFDLELAGATGLGDALGSVCDNQDQEPVRMILSAHDFGGRPRDVGSIVEEMSALAPESIGKIAWACRDICDNFAALSLVRQAPGRRIAICMGEKGLLSRVLAGKFGAFGTFCAPTEEAATAPGQVTLAQMCERYRFGRHTPDTQVYGVIGSPVAHSLSPVLFNALFDANGVDAVYLPLRVDTADELGRFLAGCVENAWMNVRGFSVTIPHKIAALRWAGSRATPDAQRIGAANTLVLDGGHIRALNTDCIGAMTALHGVPGCSQSDMRDLPVAVLGAGGAARAVVAGLCDRKCRVTIYNRSRDRAQALAAEFGCVAQPWQERARMTATVVVNCTNVGMWPAIDESPLPTEALRPGMIVFDTVYNPVETLLLRDASGAECATINGVAMFVHQAAAQYRIWTGTEPDVAFMTRIVTEHLDRGSSGTSGPSAVSEEPG